MDEPEPTVTRVRDEDGDVWHRFGEWSGWWLPPEGEVRTWEDVRDRFGPLTVVA
jgi:hypothetical protein